jgi:hypothetical protein
MIVALFRESRGVDNRDQRMLRKIARLFVIKTRIEAFLIIYALALGATARGAHYLQEYPGFGGKLLFLATTGAVFLAGAKVLDCLKYEAREKAAKASDGA